MVRERAQLQAMPLEEARHLFFEALQRQDFFDSKEEEISTRESFGRVTSRTVVAKRNVPHFRSAAMDGIAVRAAETIHASETNPVQLKLERDFVFIDTGDLIPDKFDAVIMIEKIRLLDETSVEITKEALVGKHIRIVGEDFSEEETLLDAGRNINAEAIAALLCSGNTSIWVTHQPRCIFIPTGSELVRPESALKLGELPETNSILFHHHVKNWGGCPSVHPIVKDNCSDLRAVLSDAIDKYDLIAIGSGTSKGRDDWTADLVGALGQVLVHGVAYHPGHPVLLGIAENKPIIGMPGYPVAAWVCLMQFIKPLLERYYGLRPKTHQRVKGVLVHEIRSMLGYREFVRVRLEAGAGTLQVYPLPGGASRLSSLLHADGWIEVPEEVEILSKKTSVSVNLMD